MIWQFFRPWEMLIKFEKPNIYVFVIYFYIYCIYVLKEYNIKILKIYLKF